MEAKPLQTETKSTIPRGMAPSNQNIHAGNLDTSKLAVERYLDVERNAEQLPKIECKSKDLPVQRGGQDGVTTLDFN